MKVLFQDKAVQRLLDDYQRLVGVRIAVFDTDFNELYSSPRMLSSFCQCVRQNEDINQACLHCDQKAFRQSKANKDTYIYKCHLGLYEAITPIYDNQQILGYVMIGQMLDDTNKEVKWQQMNRHYRQYSEIFSHYKTEYYNLKQMSMDDIEAVSRIMKACASSIWLQHIIDVERSPVTERIDAYLMEHFDEKLDTEKVCSDLGISKTTVYNSLKEEHGISLTKYINRYRLERSKLLLTEKKTPIAEVAAEVGFHDYNYFTRLFKNAYGKTPTQFRRSL